MRKETEKRISKKTRRKKIPVIKMYDIWFTTKKIS